MSLASRNTDSSEYQFELQRLNGGRVSCVSSTTSSIIIMDRSQDRAVPDGAQLLDSFLDEFETDPQVAAQLSKARRDFAIGVESRRGASLKTLRLAAGLSQVDLARQIGTSQAAISAYESRHRKPGEDAIRGLAESLNVDFNTLMDALDNV